MEAVATMMVENPDDSIGGMFFVSVLSHGKAAAMLVNEHDTTGASQVVEADRFVQIDHGTGNSIPLRYPGEIVDLPPPAPLPYAPYRTEWPGQLSLENRTVPAFNLKEVWEFLEEERRNTQGLDIYES